MEDKNGRTNTQALIPFLGVRRKWGAFALHIFVQFVFIYSIFVIHDHVTSGWQGLKTVKAIVADIAPGIAAAAFIPILIFAEVEILMILYNMVKEQIEARQSRRIEKIRAEGKSEGIAEGKSEGIAEGKSEGIAEGKSEGIAEGKSLAQQEWREWLKRKEAAEASGDPFNEPPPD